MTPKRGEVWFANLLPVVGHEQGHNGGDRTVLVLSTQNDSRWALSTVLPITGRAHFSHWVRLTPANDHVSKECYVATDQIRTVSHLRLRRRPLGAISPKALWEVERAVRWLLGL